MNIDKTIEQLDRKLVQYLVNRITDAAVTLRNDMFHNRVSHTLDILDEAIDKASEARYYPTPEDDG